MPNPSDYEWVDDELSDAACVTAIADAAVEAVLAAFGADPSIELTGNDAFGDDYGGAVAAHAVPGGVVAVELNGYQGSRGEVLARLSTLGLAASIFWNVEDDNAFTYASDGEVADGVDMYDAEDPEEVDLPPDLMALFVQAADDEHPMMWAVGLAMVEQFTGVAIPREAVSASSTFYAIPE
jgi:hypothetical protein